MAQSPAHPVPLHPPRAPPPTAPQAARRKPEPLTWPARPLEVCPAPQQPPHWRAPFLPPLSAPPLQARVPLPACSPAASARPPGPQLHGPLLGSPGPPCRALPLSHSQTPGAPVGPEPRDASPPAAAEGAGVGLSRWTGRHPGRPCGHLDLHVAPGGALDADLLPAGQPVLTQGHPVLHAAVLQEGGVGGAGRDAPISGHDVAPTQPHCCGGRGRQQHGPPPPGARTAPSHRWPCLGREDSWADRMQRPGLHRPRPPQGPPRSRGADLPGSPRSALRCTSVRPREASPHLPRTRGARWTCSLTECGHKDLRVSTPTQIQRAPLGVKTHSVKRPASHRDPSLFRVKGQIRDLG